MKIAYINKKWVVSGFKDTTQDNNIVKIGLQNAVFKVFDTEQEANDYIKGKFKVKELRDV